LLGWRWRITSYSSSLVSNVDSLILGQQMKTDHGKTKVEDDPETLRQEVIQE